MKIRPAWSRVAPCGQTDGRTDRHHEASSRFSQSCETRLKKKLVLYSCRTYSTPDTNLNVKWSFFVDYNSSFMQISTCYSASSHNTEIKSSFIPKQKECGVYFIVWLANADSTSFSTLSGEGAKNCLISLEDGNDPNYVKIPLSDCLIQGKYRPDHTQELKLRLICVRFQGQGYVFLRALPFSHVSYHSTIAERSGVGTMTTSEAAVSRQSHWTSPLQTQASGNENVVGAWRSLNSSRNM